MVRASLRAEEQRNERDQKKEPLDPSASASEAGGFSCVVHAQPCLRANSAMYCAKHCAPESGKAL